MELRHLRYFVSVAEALSFTKAAEKLHTAQPSLSSVIICNSFFALTRRIGLR